MDYILWTEYILVRSKLIIFITFNVDKQEQKSATRKLANVGFFSETHKLCFSSGPVEGAVSPSPEMLSNIHLNQSLKFDI